MITTRGFGGGSITTAGWGEAGVVPDRDILVNFILEIATLFDLDFEISTVVDGNFEIATIADFESGIGGD